MSIFRKLYDVYLIRKDPIKYWSNRGLKMGGGCEIYSSANFGSEPYLIELGNHVRVNVGVQFVTHDGGVWVHRVKSEYKDVDLFGKIKVGNNVHIGTNAMIMPGVTIGNNVVIGVSAVVTHDIPDNSVAVGIPAKVIETVDEYVEKNLNKFDYTKHMDSAEKKKYLMEKYVS